MHSYCSNHHYHDNHFPLATPLSATLTSNATTAFFTNLYRNNLYHKNHHPQLHFYEYDPQYYCPAAVDVTVANMWPQPPHDNSHYKTTTTT